MHGVLVDAGPLVALFDRSDPHHRRCAAALKSIREPLATVWPVIAEAMYLLNFSWEAQDGLWDMIEQRTVALLALGDADIVSMRGLMHQYRNIPMDLADAALCRVAEREGIRRIFTVDRRDFSVYRVPKIGRLSILP